MINLFVSLAEHLPQIDKGIVVLNSAAFSNLCQWPVHAGNTLPNAVCNEGIALRTKKYEQKNES